MAGERFYRIGKGYNILLASMALLRPQPRSEGMKVARRTIAASGAVRGQGRYVEFEYNILGGGEQYRTILNDYDLLLAEYAPVTVYLRDDLFNWVRMNGIAVRPQIGDDGSWTQYFPRDFKILIKHLRSVDD